MNGQFSTRSEADRNVFSTSDIISSRPGEAVKIFYLFMLGTVQSVKYRLIRRIMIIHLQLLNPFLDEIPVIKILMTEVVGNDSGHRAG